MTRTWEENLGETLDTTKRKTYILQHEITSVVNTICDFK